MSRSQTFRASVLKYTGLETTTYVDQWGVTMPKVERVADNVGLRVVARSMMRPEHEGGRVYRSKLEQRLNATPHGVDVKIDPENIEVKGIHHAGAVDLDNYKSCSRLILDIRGLGIIPELDDQKVLVHAYDVMLHRATMREFDGSFFLNEVKLTPYLNADPTKL